METSVFTNENRAFLNIPDLHLFHSLANRYDYYSECISIVERIGRVATKYRNMGYIVVAILNGDVSHRGSKNDSLNDFAAQAIKLLLSYFDEKYLNFGNHEFSYFRNNPIFKFIKEIEDPRVLARYPHLKGTSLVEDLKVVPILEYEDFEIVFTPYKFEPIRGNKKISHLIMHDDLVSDHSYNKLSTTMPEYKMKRAYVKAGMFDYIYCGHAHLIRETWMHGTTKVYNMSTLGRSNVNEIDDSFRHRLIPVILSEGGKFKEVVDEPITLHKRETVVDEEKLAKSREVYQSTKERKKLREGLAISQSKNPIQSLKEDIELMDNQSTNIIFDILISGRLVGYQEVMGRLGEIDE